jgi:hypothetical protein
MISEFFLEIIKSYLNEKICYSIFEIFQNIVTEFILFSYLLLKLFNVPLRRFFSKQYIKKYLYILIPSFLMPDGLSTGVLS